MDADAWLQRYRDVLARATSVRETGLIACGLTTNIDHVAKLDAVTFRRLLAGREIALDGPRITAPIDITELVTAIAQCVALGEGYDLPVSFDLQEWLIAHAPGERRLGGSGSQAAGTLVSLGFSALVHLTGCSSEQAAAFPAPERLVVAREGDLTPICAAIEPRDETMVHVALEYDAGLQAPSGGQTIAAPAGNRVIVSHDPVNSAFRIDPDYVAAVADPANGVERVLMSGYSQITETSALRRLLAESVHALGLWRVNRPDLVVHLELGAMPRLSDLALVVTTLGRLVSSIGMNIDECRDLARAFDLPRPASMECAPATLRAIRERTGAKRIVLHSAECALAVVDGDSERMRDGLFFGCLAAATRARVGSFPTVADLWETLATCRVGPIGVDFASTLTAEDVIAVPGIEIVRPAAAVGLGDSFTAGLLAML